MASRPRVLISSVATGILLAGAAAAQEPPPASPPPQASAPPAPAPLTPPTRAPAAPMPPGQRTTAPRRPAAPQKAVPKRSAPAPKGKRAPEVVVPPPYGTPIASFPGFSRLDDGKTRVFVEVSRKVDVAESRTHGRVTYRLRGTTVVQRTNQMALVTGYFTTPVGRVQLVPAGSDLDVVIELREATEPTHTVVETPRGMVLWVDFPRSVAFGREESPSEAGRPRAKRSTQKIGAGTPPDDAPPPMDDN
jgi:hypothetical protein